MKKRLICICLVLAMAECSDDSGNPYHLSDDVIKYLDEVRGIMQTHSINKDNIDWNDFKTQMYERAAGSQVIQQITNGLYWALKMLGDNHSSILRSDGIVIFAGSLSCSGVPVSKPDLPSNIGYVKVESFSGSASGTQALAFAQAIQDQIRSQDNNNIIGWIVDLRGNGGGNMWPMIAGIGPILGEGTAGYFDDPASGYSSWGYANGASVSGGGIVTLVTSPYVLLSPMPKVAVLLDQGVASSGEIVAVSFIGREKCKSFGASSCGLSTSNVSFKLSNNWNLNLTTSYQADRNKKRYGVPIAPDLAATSDTIITQAVNWLNN